VSLLGASILLTVLSFFSRRTREATEDIGESVNKSPNPKSPSPPHT
jgi:hypothetical protein